MSITLLTVLFFIFVEITMVRKQIYSHRRTKRQKFDQLSMANKHFFISLFFSLFFSSFPNCIKENEKTKYLKKNLLFNYEIIFIKYHLSVNKEKMSALFLV